MTERTTVPSADTMPADGVLFEDALFEGAPVAYLVTTLDGVIRRANRRCVDVLGRRRRPLLGARLRSLVAPDDHMRLQALVDDAVGHGGVAEATLTFLVGGDTAGPDGVVLTSMHVAVSKGISSAHPDVSELRVVLQPVDDPSAVRARTADRVRDDLAVARQVIGWQSTMLAAAFHDLRTPLSVIMTTLETLLVHADELSSDRSGRMLLRAQDHVARLSRIIDGLHRLSRQDLSLTAVERRPRRLDEMVNQVAKTLPRGEFELEVQLEQLWIDVDGELMDQVLDNLIRNALVHGGDGVHIRVRSRTFGRDVLIVVEDDGPGIAADVKERVFLPFHSTASDRGGTGLGLAIVGMLVAVHGGRVWVDDADEGGAAFHVLLPAAVPTGNGHSVD